MRTTLRPMDDYLEIVAISKDDFDLAQANQTPQSVKIYTIPANSIVNYLTITNIGPTITSSGTLDHFNISVGTTVGGTDLLAQSDLATTGNSISMTSPTIFSSSQTPVYITFTPAGSGSNFNTLSNTMVFSANVFVSVPA